MRRLLASSALVITALLAAPLAALLAAPLAAPLAALLAAPRGTPRGPPRGPARSLGGYTGGYGCSTNAPLTMPVPSIGVACLQPTVGLHLLVGTQAASGPRSLLRLEAGLGRTTDPPRPSNEPVVAKPAQCE